MRRRGRRRESREEREGRGGREEEESIRGREKGRGVKGKVHRMHGGRKKGKEWGNRKRREKVVVKFECTSFVLD